MNKTLEQYDSAFAKCRTLFCNKTKDYGTSWRVLRPKSLTDQLFIKAQRIQTLEENKHSKVGEGIEPEFIALVNYAVIGLIQLGLDKMQPLELTESEALEHYVQQEEKIKQTA